VGGQGQVSGNQGGGTLKGGVNKIAGNKVEERHTAVVAKAVGEHLVAVGEEHKGRHRLVEATASSGWMGSVDVNRGIDGFSALTRCAPESL
jgi:hypothetical protein